MKIKKKEERKEEKKRYTARYRMGNSLIQHTSGAILNQLLMSVRGGTVRTKPVYSKIVQSKKGLALLFFPSKIVIKAL